MKLTIIFLALFMTSLSSYSQDQVSEEKNFAARWWDSTKNKMTTIYDEGLNDLYLTGYAYHDRNTYTKEKLKDLNEGAYGAGIGRSIINEKGNSEMLYAMIHLDSHKDIQAEAGYAWQKNFTIKGSFKLGIGFASGLVSRTDIAGRIPVPFILPMGSIDIGRASLNAILVPKLNDGINNGNVLFIFGKFSWDRKKEVIL